MNATLMSKTQMENCWRSSDIKGASWNRDIDFAKTDRNRFSWQKIRNCKKIRNIVKSVLEPIMVTLLSIHVVMLRHVKLVAWKSQKQPNLLAHYVNLMLSTIWRYSFNIFEISSLWNMKMYFWILIVNPLFTCYLFQKLLSSFPWKEPTKNDD